MYFLMRCQPFNIQLHTIAIHPEEIYMDITKAMHGYGNDLHPSLCASALSMFEPVSSLFGALRTGSRLKKPFYEKFNAQGIRVSQIAQLVSVRLP